MNKKACSKCKKEHPATLEFFYKHSASLSGLTPRCKPCVNEDNKRVHANRLKENPERVRALANARSKKNYRKDLERSRKKSRVFAQKMRLDPEKKIKIQTRKRGGGAGLSPEELNTIRRNQENKCAICCDFNPTDLDHCHATGRVRFLLCRHCNRGLGAFRDRPDLMRKAALMLEKTNDSE